MQTDSNLQCYVRYMSLLYAINCDIDPVHLSLENENILIYLEDFEVVICLSIIVSGGTEHYESTVNLRDSCRTGANVPWGFVSFCNLDVHSLILLFRRNPFRTVFNLHSFALIRSSNSDNASAFPLWPHSCALYILTEISALDGESITLTPQS